MKYGIFSDPHLGTKRMAGTTAKSAALLERRLFDTALSTAGMLAETCDTVMLFGDLFDKARNSESVIWQAAQVLQLVDVCVGGNHDVRSYEGHMSSLELLKETMRGNRTYIVMQDDMDGIAIDTFGEMTVIPHHASNEQFHRALDQAIKYNQKASGNRYLALHANREMDGLDMADSQLIVTEEDENRLLETFTRIFYGHLHNPVLLKDGRVVIVGNTHPTSFSDCSSKYAWVLDSDTDKLEPVEQYSANRYATIDLTSDIELAQDKDFVTVSGQGSRADTLRYINAIRTAFPGTIAIRSTVTYPEVDAALKRVEVEDVFSTIRSALGDRKDLLEMFEQIMQEM